MDENKLVSIVMPTYNGSKYIADSIKSLIKQTYKNIEIIIIDDGSTDSVVKICSEYASKDERIRVISTSNRGVSSARNTGITEAKGDYIVFMDDDDCPFENLIQKYMEAYDQWSDKKVSFVTCGMIFRNYYNKRVNDKEYILESGRGYVRGENYLLTRNYAATLAWLKLFNFVTNKCYDLEIIKKSGIIFDEKISVGEDLKFNIDYLEQSEGYLGMINLPLYYYIKRKDDGLSVKYHSDDLTNTKQIYRRFIAWEQDQKEVTADNIVVLKSLFIYDWTNRLTAIYKMHKGESPFSCAKRDLNKELRSKEFREMLLEVRKAKKISTFRYLCLRTGNYEIFYFFRYFYQALKG
ncbi:glycosyltransferase family 2 protein [Butyrivibrio sp. AD3002]|uniref:glycosyltransferase family 2 protein n=1 Tax=Butyrivibrio sp. AD3002 TaxID=1280670 RepID=UPI0003B671D8|nr:glycosyltransferase family 2 protein [Butyrivibrio sp. AD3002]